MKIVDRKKFVKSICGMVLVIFILSLICSKATLSHKEVEYTTLYVSKGDTLWTIAQQLQNSNDYYKSKDVRDIVYSIKNINTLETSSIYVGQELIIPTI